MSIQPASIYQHYPQSPHCPDSASDVRQPGWSIAAAILAFVNAALLMYVALPIYLYDLLGTNFTPDYDRDRSGFVWTVSLATGNVVIASIALVAGVLLLLRSPAGRWFMTLAAGLVLGALIAWGTWTTRVWPTACLFSAPLLLGTAFAWPGSVTRWLAAGPSGSPGKS